MDYVFLQNAKYYFDIVTKLGYNLSTKVSAEASQYNHFFKNALE